MGIAASGLSAQRTRIETIADNIANAETTRTDDGAPYRRKIVDLQEVPFSEALDRQGMAGVPPAAWPPVAGQPAPEGGVQVQGVVEDLSEGPMVYDPGHPDADENGYVEMPNVSITQEMVSLLEARRLYEANASVFDAVKSMLRRATEL
jgi:flagellar basal-body rod protein FlgC